nr:thioesterase family protein [Gordonia soli]
MDINNHINNVQFARLFEESRVRAFSTWFPTRPARLSMLVARQDIEFTATLDYSPDPVVVHASVSRLGTSSFTMTLILDDASGTTCAMAETTMVVVDPATGRPTPMEDDLRSELERWRGPRAPFHDRR